MTIKISYIKSHPWRILTLGRGTSSKDIDDGELKLNQFMSKETKKWNKQPNRRTKENTENVNVVGKQ